MTAGWYRILSKSKPMTREQIADERRRLKAEYGALFDAMAALLFRYDPIGINFGTNTDEYEPEVRTILPRLKDCRTEADVTCVVYEEFVQWFGDAGPMERYEQIGSEIWELWQKQGNR